MSVSIHLRNLAFNWGGHAATLLVMFFLSPYIVGKLDAVSYGIWSLLNVLTGYMGIFDLGVRASVGRHVALYLGKDDSVGVDETIRAGFGFFSMVGVLILIVGILLGWLFPVMFEGVSSEHYGTVRVLLPLMVVNVWMSAVASIYSSVLAAHDRFDIARGVDLVVLLVRTAGTIYVLDKGWNLWGLVFVIIAGNFCAAAGNRISAGRIYPKLRTFPFLFSKERIKELLGYGIAAFCSNAAVKIIGQSDLVIVGVFLAVADVREYNVGAMLIYYSATFIVIVCRTFFPSIQRAAASDAFGEVRYLFFRQIRVTLCFGLLVYIGFVFYSRSFIDLWMFQDGFGNESVIAAAEVMTILALSKFPTLLIQPCVYALAALGHVGYTAKVAVVEAFFNLLFSIVFVTVFDMGIAGVAAGTLAARLLIPSVAIPNYLFAKLGLSLWTFIKTVAAPATVVSLLFSTWCWFWVQFSVPEMWFQFGLQIFSALLVWMVLSFFILVPVDLRQRLLAKLNFK